MTLRVLGTLSIVALALAGCGADGPPETPERPVQPSPQSTPQPITDVEVNIGSGGYSSVGVGVTRGPVSLGIGF